LPTSAKTFKALSLTAIRTRIEACIGQRPDQLSRLSGGCVGDVFQAALPDGRTVVAKVGESTSHLDLEGRMLTYLAQHSALPVPDVLFADKALLVMTWIESRGELGPQVQKHAAELIAALHAITTDQGFGFAYDTVIGGLSQPNPWTSGWVDFFRNQRLIYMSEEAARCGRLPSTVQARLERFAASLGRWLEEPAQPALIHGDLWAGNILSASNRITGFIDPALYYADPEIELAFTTLFNTFGTAFFNRYSEFHTIKPGFFEDRRDIYNLYPLLVHVRLFGGSYVNAVETTLHRFGF